MHAPFSSRSAATASSNPTVKALLAWLAAGLLAACGSVRSEGGDSNDGSNNSVPAEVVAITEAEIAMYDSFCGCSASIGAKYETKEECLKALGQFLGYASAPCIASAVANESDGGVAFAACAREVFDEAKQCSDTCGADWLSKDCLGKLHSGIQFCTTKLSAAGAQLAPACFFLPVN